MTRLARILTLTAQAGLLLVAVALCLRGGPPLPCLAIAVVLPLLLLIHPGYRRLALAWLKRQREDLTADLTPTRPLPWLATGVFVMMPSAILFMANGRTASTGDTWPVVPTACQLVRSGNCDLTTMIAAAPPGYCQEWNHGLPYCVAPRDSGIYSTYPSGMVPFALIAALPARLVGADLTRDQVHDRLEKWTSAWVSAAIAGLFYLLARHLVPAMPALLATGFLVTGSVLLTTCSQGAWQHSGVLFWLLIALLVEFRRGAGHAVTSNRYGGDLLQGLCLAMMVACRLSAGLLAVSLGIWLLFRSPTRAVRVGAAALLAFLPWALFHLTIYGNLAGPSVGQAAGKEWDIGDLTTRLTGLLFSPSRGLFVYQPWLIPGLLGGLLVVSARRWPTAGPAGWVWFCLAAAGLHLLLIGMWRCWWGGHCYGSRLATEAIVLLSLAALPGIALLWQRRAGRVVLLAALVLGGLLHLPETFRRPTWWNAVADIDHHPERLWSWSGAPFLGKPSFGDPSNLQKPVHAADQDSQTIGG